MLIPLGQLISKYNLNIRGVIHVGAHHLEEYYDYIYNGICSIIAIEPSKKAFSVLDKSFKDNPHVCTIQAALGEEEGFAEMNLSEHTMSNSLLKPKLHLDQHPDVIFKGTEIVPVMTLDSIAFDRERFNMLNMDVQGFEGSVLRGGSKSLQFIDYVYTEVNRDEVYENCTRIEEMDILLSDFKRVETQWNGNWGDSLYIRNSLF